MKNQKGFSSILALVIVVLIGAGVYAVVNRSVLKSFFEKGDKPTAEQFGGTIDSSSNPVEDKNLTSHKEYDPTKQYQAGDITTQLSTISETKVLSQDQKEFTLDKIQDVVFKWTPVVPKPQESVTYRLRVWQLMQGQNGSQAMSANEPVVTKDVVDVSETTIGNIYTGPCRPPYLCDFIWSVETITKSNSNSGTSGGSGSSAVDTTVSAESSTSTK